MNKVTDIVVNGQSLNKRYKEWQIAEEVLESAREAADEAYQKYINMEMYIVQKKVAHKKIAPSVPINGWKWECEICGEEKYNCNCVHLEG